jgi:predicted dehydrogenase
MSGHQHNSAFSRERSGRVSRRQFLAGGAAALAAPSIVSASVFGASSPSNRLNLGIIGQGGRGSHHRRALLSRDDVTLRAVCDPFQSKAAEGAKQANKAYEDRGNGKTCTAYQDFRELLDRDDIDGVVIASPENWHGVHASMAVRAGKDVYCEKSLTQTVDEGRALVETVRRHGAILQAGTQQRSSARFRRACELARNGKLGRLREVQVAVPGQAGGWRATKEGIWPVKQPPSDLDYDLWLGPAAWKPYREDLCTFQWYFVRDYCPGWIASWGVHHMDIAMWGVPAFHEGRVKVSGTAEFFDGTADVSYAWDTLIEPEDGPRLRFVNRRADGFHQGIRFIGDRGWVHVNRGSLQAEPSSLLDQHLAPSDERLQRSNQHHSDFLQAMRTRRDPVAPVEACHGATALTIVADIATRLGRPVTWDWAAHRCINDEPANRMLGRTMRSPWRV